MMAAVYLEVRQQQEWQQVAFKREVIDGNLPIARANAGERSISGA